MIARALLAAASVGVALVLALSLEAANAEQRAKVVAFSPGSVTGGRLESALHDAKRARRLAPDSDAGLLEAFLLARAKRRAATLHTLEQVVADEPENVDAWVFLSNAAADPRRARRARRRAEQLDPFLARSR